MHNYFGSIYTICKVLTKAYYEEEEQIYLYAIVSHGRHQREKKSLSVGPKGGRRQPEFKIFEVVFLFPILTAFWIFNGGEGGGRLTMFQKF